MWLQVRLCAHCGEEGGEDPYCDQCSGDVIEVEVQAKAAKSAKEQKVTL
jgi:hypothetical protein